MYNIFYTLFFTYTFTFSFMTYVRLYTKHANVWRHIYRGCLHIRTRLEIICLQLLLILYKILSSRLNPIIGSLIHKDQVVFIPLRQAGDNVRRAVLTHLARTHRIPTCLLSIDIKKAFDSLSWPYLKYTLQKWGFGPTTCNGYFYYTPLPQPVTNMQDTILTPFR